ncbi:hypothetical protein A2U01_0062400, partial [Trifolium medium]|nr:hypothetical protein [Trifolium medium]
RGMSARLATNLVLCVLEVELKARIARALSLSLAMTRQGSL